MKDNKNITYLIIALAIFGIISVLFISPVCQDLVEMANGNMTFMKCHYTAQTVVAMYIILIILNLEALKKKKHMFLSNIVIALYSSIMTFSNKLGIGMCMNNTMPCHKTATFIRVISVIIIILSLVLKSNDKSYK